MKLMRRFALVMVALGPTIAFADTSSWQESSFACARPIKGCDSAGCCALSLTIYVRDQKDSGIREVRAIGEVDASPERVFAVLTDYDHYTEFMPHTVGSRLIRRQDDTVVVWGMVDPPIIARRDWVTESRLESDLPGGVFRTTWHSAPELGPPPEDGVVPMRVNNGSWTLEPIDDGARTRGTYEQASDPGGSVPSFIVRSASTKGVADLFEAIRRRAVQ